MSYSPQRVVWEITYKCNINCIHCGSDCANLEKSYQLTTKECLNVINQLSKLGCKSIVLSGGEPFMRKDWAVIASAIMNQGMLVSFISNGYLLNEENVKILGALKPNAVGISIDAADWYLHDYIRGINGIFDRVINAIHLLHANNLVPSVVTTVHKLNFEQLPKIRELLVKNKVKYWQIQYGNLIGRMTRDFMITEAQFYETGKFIAETRNKYGKYFAGINGADGMGYYGDLGKHLHPNWRGCHAGICALGIESDGNIKGCLSLQLEGFTEGNIRDKSLIEIWNDPESFKYNRQFDLDLLSGYCKECLYSALCKAGCLKSATSLSGGGRCNPLCFYKLEKEGFSSEEQARIKFSKQELADIYGKIRPLPDKFFE